MPARRIACLDGLRGIAVLMVICFHFEGMLGLKHGFIARLAVWGQTGVDLFFVLSGFLITGILLDTRGTPDFLRFFYARRILRIFPLYYATLFVVFILAPMLSAGVSRLPAQQLWFWTYLQNIPLTFSQSSAIGPTHFWSLAVEEHFYLFWPFLVMRLDRRGLLRVIGVMILVSIATRILLSQYATFYFTLARMDGLGIGAALAVIAREPGGLRRIVKLSRRTLLIVGAALAIAQFFLSGRHLEFLQITKSTLIAFVYAALMTLAIEDRLLESVLTHPALRAIGKYSYAMYIFHPFILEWMREAGFTLSLASLVIAVAATWCAAVASWYLLERNFLTLKERFEYRQPAMAAA